MLLAMNQIVNMAAKMYHMYAGTLSVPLVVRSIIGKSWGQGAQHSQSIYPLLMNIPGLKITAPSTPYDAKGCLIQSIRDNNPVIFIEHRMLYYQKGPVPADPYTVPFGKARLLSEGRDVTLIGISQMAIECLRAQQYLKEVGINAEVIDPLSLSPLDIETINASVMKTGNLIIVDNAWITCGAGAEIIARLIEVGRKNINIQRMGFASVPCPTSPPLESEFYPDARKIAITALKMLNPKKKNWEPKANLPIEEVEFKGPF
jgi:pyruvate/2-oxoglutarate/acetoin dehydrogenase E1 component